ncbi:hypothetical protein B0A55_09706 [Friedmanniomyces simplex]|uniref:Cytochrome c oxidase assembly protein COX20, mitochondrial n=1 Tax=Friedmanniomyces simplex TaxID=329884 RepID=A0A4U0WZ32_9PEZI|nr:hypothetical protein B0A55_09706 [Friedmanniomyces simplex]
MADDTRQSPEDLSREALTVHPENKPFTGTAWQNGKIVPYTPPPQNANMMAGGTEHTAGGKAPEVNLANAFQSGLKLSDFTDLPKRPCVRDALLTGIGSGFALGGFRAIFGAAVWNACSWAVGSFCFSSASMYQYCMYRRQAEKEGMLRVMDIMNKKDIERKAREQRKEKAREERRLVKDQELDTQLATLREGKAGGGVAIGGGADGGGGGEIKPWWKVW